LSNHHIGTLTYKLQHELNCHQCNVIDPHSPDRDCRRCYFDQTPAVHDRFYISAVQPYIYFSAVLLFLSYIIGLLFTLRTHAAIIWNNEADEKKAEKTETPAQHVEHRHGGTQESNPLARQATSTSINTVGRDNIKDTQLYKRILGQSLKQAGFPESARSAENSVESTPTVSQAPHLVPPKSSDESVKRATGSVRIPGLSTEDNNALVRQVAEMAATAATVAARDATRAPRRASQLSINSTSKKRDTSTAPADRSSIPRMSALTAELDEVNGGAPGDANAQAPGGHDAPNWSRTKSVVILLTATVAYAVIAEILVDTVDSVLEHVDIDEKFLGITLFALVPNTTEFLNAISFAMNGNIALSMEIGSAYALQVMLLQVPALVLFSAIHGQFIDPGDVIDHTFNLLFPQWDMVTVILGLFLMNYVVAEGKSNYFKGSMLVLSYLVVVVGFYFSGFNSAEVSPNPYKTAVAQSNANVSFSDDGYRSLRHARRRQACVDVVQDCRADEGWSRILMESVLVPGVVALLSMHFWHSVGLVIAFLSLSHVTLGSCCEVVIESEA